MKRYPLTPPIKSRSLGERDHMESGGGRHELPSEAPIAKPGHLWFFDGYGGWHMTSVEELLQPA